MYGDANGHPNIGSRWWPPVHDNEETFRFCYRDNKHPEPPKFLLADINGKCQPFCLVTARNSSCGKVMFYRCLSVHGEGVYPSMQWLEMRCKQTSPRETAQSDPPRQTSSPQVSPLADTPPPRPLNRAVSILLECILVY